MCTLPMCIYSSRWLFHERLKDSNQRGMQMIPSVLSVQHFNTGRRLSEQVTIMTFYIMNPKKTNNFSNCNFIHFNLSCLINPFNIFISTDLMWNRKTIGVPLDSEFA